MTEATAGPYSTAAGIILRRARKNAGLSLPQAAEKANGRFTAQALRSWEAGQRKLTVDRLVELAHLYGIPPASLLPREPDPEIDEAVVAAAARILARGNVHEKIARMLAGGRWPASDVPSAIPEPGEPLVLMDDEVDMLEAVVRGLRAQQRARDTMPTVDEPDDDAGGTP